VNTLFLDVDGTVTGIPARDDPAPARFNQFEVDGFRVNVDPAIVAGLNRLVSDDLVEIVFCTAWDFGLWIWRLRLDCGQRRSHRYARYSGAMVNRSLWVKSQAIAEYRAAAGQQGETFIVADDLLFGRNGVTLRQSIRAHFPAPAPLVIGTSDREGLTPVHLRKIRAFAEEHRWARDGAPAAHPVRSGR